MCEVGAGAPVCPEYPELPTLPVFCVKAKDQQYNTVRWSVSYKPESYKYSTTERTTFHNTVLAEVDKQFLQFLTVFNQWVKKAWISYWKN